MAKTEPTSAPAQDANPPQASAASPEAVSPPASAPSIRATAVSADTTYTLNSSNHPGIGEDGLVIGDKATPIPNATQSLLDFLDSLPGVTVTTLDPAQ